MLIAFEILLALFGGIFLAARILTENIKDSFRGFNKQVAMNEWEEFALKYTIRTKKEDEDFRARYIRPSNLDDVYKKFESSFKEVCPEDIDPYAFAAGHLGGFPSGGYPNYITKQHNLPQLDESEDWVYHWILASHGKVNWYSANSGYQIGRTNIEFNIKCARELEKILNQNGVNLKLVFYPARSNKPNVIYGGKLYWDLKKNTMYTTNIGRRLW